MKIKQIIQTKKFLLLLLLLNFTGIILSFMTYTSDIIKHINQKEYFIIPFLMVSFWLYLLAFFFLLYKYLDIDHPKLLGELTFIYCFVYGIGSFIFYPLFMAFVRGITPYHLWNIIAHGFVGLQSIIFLKLIKKPKTPHIIILAGIFILKNILDLYYNGFLYFTKFTFPQSLKFFLIILIISLQIIAFYLLITRKRLK